MVYQVKPQHEMLICHRDVVLCPGCFQLPVDGLGNAVEDGPSVWTQMGDTDQPPRSWLQPLPMLVIVDTYKVNHWMEDLSSSLSLYN